jgi:hypothetical protein
MTDIQTIARSLAVELEEANQALRRGRELLAGVNLEPEPAPINAPAEEQLRKLAEAVRVFRNDPLLARLGGLRGKPGYIGLCAAWDDALEFLGEARE